MNIKLKTHFWETAGIKDIGQGGKTQRVLNAQFAKQDIIDDLMKDEIENTAQSITFGQDGGVQSISHVRNSTTVRTDTFTFTDAAITEVRTLSTGQSLTIVTNLATLQSVITYSES